MKYIEKYFFLNKIMWLNHRHEGILTKKEQYFLKVTNPRVALFYSLPKIHKNPTRLLGRPIIALVDSLSNLLQYYLQKYVIKLDPYLKDTASVIKEVVDIKWLPGCRWATLDVAALYSNIPHDKGLSTICNYLASDDSMPEHQKIFILEGIRFILKHNLFKFNNQLYIQTNGTAMGMRFEPSFANLYMGEFEKDHIMCHHPWRNNIISFKRYIDDLLFIWDRP